MEGANMDSCFRRNDNGGGGNDTGGDWAEMIGEGGGDGRDKNGFRVKPGMTGLVGLLVARVGGGDWKDDGDVEHGFRIKSGMTGCVGGNDKVCRRE